MKNNISVAFLVDGSFLPIGNGTDYSILTLMESLSRVGDVEPSLLLSWRGWDSPELYSDKFFRTIFVPIKHFYEQDGVIEYMSSTLNIDFVHIYNSEEVVNLADRFRNSGVKVIYEAVNIDHVLNERLNVNSEMVSSSKKLQFKAMEMADYVMCRSHIDKNHIINMGIDNNKVSVYRGAINVKAIPFIKRNRLGKNIVFMGHMYYPPNENSLEYIARGILPNLKKINKDYKVTILGSIPKNVVDKYSDTDIIFKGNIDDIGSELLKYDIAIAPLFEGSGTRLKILDYMASGIPTITTTLGVEGLHEDILKSLIIEDEICNYAGKINNLLCDGDLYEKLSIDGRNYVEKYYSWDSNLGPFLDIYRK